MTKKKLKLRKGQKALLGLFLHLIVFLSIQLTFSVIGDYHNDWHIFRLSPSGDRAVSFLKPLSDIVQIHESYQFNVMTGILIVALLIHVITILLDFTLFKKHKGHITD